MKAKIIITLICATMLCGCISHRDAQEIGNAFAAPFGSLALRLSGSEDLAYTVASFQRKNNRWPNDYAELSSFVQHSDGYLYLGDYTSVMLSNSLPDNRLVITFIPKGLTNRITLFCDTNQMTVTLPAPSTNAIAH